MQNSYVGNHVHGLGKFISIIYLANHGHNLIEYMCGNFFWFYDNFIDAPPSSLLDSRGSNYVEEWK
jgi:hypothetical protein